MKLLGSYLFLIFVSSFSWAQNLLLFDGESAAINGCTYEYGYMDSTHNAHTGTFAFCGTPDQWHVPAFSLNCQNQFRADLSKYNELWFYTKSSVAGNAYRIALTMWPNTSKSLDITPYIQGNTLTTNYQLVRIPLDSLKSSTISLAGVEMILLDTSSIAGRKIYIDDMMAVDTKAAKVDSLAICSSQALQLHINESYDTTVVRTPQNYVLTSTDDSDFLVGQHPSQVGMHYFVSQFAKTGPISTVKYELFMTFQHEMKSGKHYQLTVNNIRDRANNDFSAPQQLTFTYYDTLVTGSVKVNQIGYLTDSPKYGYIGNYLGSIGVLECSPTQFYIKDSKTNQVKYSGTPIFKGYDSKLSGEKVYECDFSTFTEEGNYYLYVPALGRSYPFSIASNVYDSVYYAIAKEFYYQRCGVDLKVPYADARFTHPACHTQDAKTDTALYQSALYNGETMDSIILCPHGWHDAGDFGKYTMNAALYLYYLFQAYQYFPERFGDHFVQIPESGNGVPDLLDECKFELDWLKEMQAPDGGVYDRVSTTHWVTALPENDQETRYYFQKTTYSTAYFCAIMARAAKDLHPFFPSFADSLLVKSEKAWKFLEQHPTPLPLPGSDPLDRLTIDPDGDTHHRAWACAELYRATGKSYYDGLFHQYWSKNPVLSGTNPIYNNQNRASITYATISEYPTDSIVRQKLLPAWKQYCDNLLIPFADQNTYRLSLRTDTYWAIGWGSFAQSPWYSLDLLIGYQLLKNPKYVDYAKLNLNVQLGANPQNICYITGLGSKSPQDPLHMQSINDAVAAPVPGIAVYGPSAHMSMANPYDYQVQCKENVYPKSEQETDPYPIYRRYWDHYQNVAQSEFSVGSQAMLTFVYGFFNSTQAYRVTPLPTTHGQISRTTPVVLDKGKSYTFHFTPATGYHVSNVYIDSISVGPMNTYTFSNITQNHTLSVEFQKDSYTITANVKPENAGVIVGLGNYMYGDTVLLRVIPNTGYQFNDWTENNTNLNDSVNYSFIATSNRSLTANLIAKDTTPVVLYELNVSPNPTFGNVEVAVNSSYKGDVTIQLINVQGDVLETQTNTKNELVATYVIKTAEYAAGTYFVEVVYQGKKSRVKLLVL